MYLKQQQNFSNISSIKPFIDCINLRESVGFNLQIARSCFTAQFRCFRRCFTGGIVLNLGALVYLILSVSNVSAKMINESSATTSETDREMHKISQDYFKDLPII